VWRTTALVGLAAAAYFLSARVGYAFAVPQGVVTLWPPSGVMLGLLCVSGTRNWPALVAGGLLGSVLSDLQSGYSGGLALFAALANVTESLAGAWVMTQRLGSPLSLGRVRALATLVLGVAVASNAVTSLLGAGVLSYGFGSSFARGWFVWWAGDGLGMLVCAPVLMTWREAHTDWTPSRALEALVLAGGVAGAAELGVGRSHEILGMGAYLTFPVLFWAGLRFGSWGAALANLSCAGVATWSVALNGGPFVAPGLAGSQVALRMYIYLLVASTTSLLLAAVLKERRVAATRQAESDRALRDAEERMRFALEAARVGIWEADLATGHIHWSRMLEALHGMEAGSFTGTLDAFMERVHVDDRQSVRQAIETASHQQDDATILYRTTWPDGSVHWMSGLGRTAVDAEGRPIRAAGIGIDVTERLAMEEQSRQSQKMETIGQLAGGVAHDFNNLLTAILGHALMMAEAVGPDSPHQTDLSEIRTAAERATSLTTQLLAFSRRQILAPRIVNLGDAIRALTPMLKRLIGEHIEIVVRAPSDVGRVLADPGQIDQVLLNLALNARDAMPDGGTLSLGVTNAELDEAYVEQHPDASPGRYVLVTVSDTGVGMDAQTMARVFEPFFTTKDKGKGTGLGLSTVYGIVKQSGGHTCVYSEPHHGSAFKVYLPLADAAAVDQPTAQSIQPSSSGTETVLLVEDDERIRRLAIRILTGQGYQVLAASTPEEALEFAAKGQHFDVLVTDVVLPGISGRALAEQMRGTRVDLPVIYMSGYTDDIIARYGVLESGVAFLQKPFTPAALLKSLRETLDSRPGR
jgi:PAS domain S-box-containing protein